MPLMDKLEFQRESLLDLLSKLNMQASMFLKRVQADTAGQQAVTLAEEIVKTYQLAEKAVQKFRTELHALESANLAPGARVR